MPELFLPKLSGSLPALKRSYCQNIFSCSRSSVAKSVEGLKNGPASNATTFKPAAANLAKMGAPPAPVPIITASTISLPENICTKKFY